MSSSDNGRVLLLGGAMVALLVGLFALVTVLADRTSDEEGAETAAPTSSAPVARAAPTTRPAPTTTSSTTTIPPYDGWVDPASSGQPWTTEVEGLLTFRGNPTRTYYGQGPVPSTPEIRWTFPASGSLCSLSTVGDSTTEWCGTGWTGQPSVFRYDDRTWVAFGSYESAVHFLDADTGEQILPDFPVGDIIKGSVTIDPDGFPLLYTGSRDDFFRVVAFDRPDAAEELWSLAADAVSPILWNNDWDGAALVIDDYLFEGGENSQLHIVKLNRGYDDEGQVTVDPELVFNAPGWDDELVQAVGSNVSIESSVAISGNTLYFANSGGLVQGWDITELADGVPPERVFRYWTGDDVDGTIAIDEEGMLYVGVEYERGTGRSQEVGQIIKLDPTQPDDPLVWKRDERPYIDSGVWATPALYEDIVIVPTDEGVVLGLDRQSGEERWSMKLQGPTWQSPVIVDDTLIMGDCNGVLHGYDASDTSTTPVELWSVNLGGCIESTPAVWDGGIYVGTRGGQFHALADPG
ncbi:MAG: PQQ-binding-like beta-propeller repeat protein [Acidimicrobiales bacterium]